MKAVFLHHMGIVCNEVMEFAFFWQSGACQTKLHTVSAGFLCAANRGDDCRDIEVDSVKKLAHEVLVCLIHLFSITQNSFIYAFIYICNFVYMIKEQYGVSNGH